MHRLTSFQKDLLITLALALVTLILGTYTGVLVLERGPSAKDTAAELALVSSRDIIAHDTEEGADGLVGYAYVGGKLPELLAPDERPERRTENSWTRLVSGGADGGAQVIATTIVYPKQAFVRRDDGWHYVEYGRTPRKVMDRYGAAHAPLSVLFTAIAHADTFSSTSGGDADISYTAAATSTSLAAFNTAQGATTGTSLNTNGFTGSAGVSDINIKSENVSIYRAFFPFNTSSIPAGATITAASLTVYGTSTGALGTMVNDGKDYITVVQTTQTDYSSPAAGDYSKNGSPITNPTEGIATGSRKDISSGGFATTTGGQSAPNTFTLDATGISWIKKAGQASACSASTGITCLGLREGHDTTRTAISVNTYSYVTWVQTDNTGTEADPYLSVTYSVPFAFWQFQDY